MKLLFVTGCDSAFFNTFLICLQSFAERISDQRLFVCDFGLTSAQAQFLRHLGLLLVRPTDLAARGTFHCKAALARYLQHNAHRIEDYDAVVWLDADLTLMEVGFGDFAAVGHAMTASGALVAACREPANSSIGQVISSHAATMTPFVRVATQAAIDHTLPYLSSGLFFCRSAAFLQRWMELTDAVAEHPLFEQNMFNMALYNPSIPLLALDCEEWQAQGHSLDRVRLFPSSQGGRPAAGIGDKNIKTLHTTSGASGHLLIGVCRMTVRDLDLTGPFKLFLSESLRMYQLQLLASLIAAHNGELLRLGICSRATTAVDGFQFVTL
jgi:hypothetical protein